MGNWGNEKQEVSHSGFRQTRFFVLVVISENRIVEMGPALLSYLSGQIPYTILNPCFRLFRDDVLSRLIFLCLSQLDLPSSSLSLKQNHVS